MMAQGLFQKRPAGRRTVVQETREGDICLQAVVVIGQKRGRLMFPSGALWLAILEAAKEIRWQVKEWQVRVIPRGNGAGRARV